MRYLFQLGSILLLQRASCCFDLLIHVTSFKISLNEGAAFY